MTIRKHCVASTGSVDVLKAPPGNISEHGTATLG